MGVKLVCTPAGENFSFSGFHCNKISAALILWAHLLGCDSQTFGGTGRSTNTQSFKALHPGAELVFVFFCFFNFILMMTGFVFDALEGFLG